jgi:hypothetical protein
MLFMAYTLAFNVTLLFEHHDRKAYWLEREAPCILDFGSGWFWVVNSALWLLYSIGRKHRYWDRWWVGPSPGWSGYGNKEKCSLQLRTYSGHRLHSHFTD